MIPKIIHYCWFGKGEKPQLIINCINSWKKYCPDYEIIEWNEDNFDVSMYKYTKEAYEAKKWAFVSDVARLYALYNCGGVYLDTDVELLKPIDRFLHHKAFTGFESKDCPITAVLGCGKGNSVIKYLLGYYDDAKFVDNMGNYDLTTNTNIITRCFLANGVKPNGKIQEFDNLIIYPQKYFCPNTFGMLFGVISKSTYAIHLGAASWKCNGNDLTSKYTLKSYLVNKARCVFGTDTVEKIRDKLKYKY